MRSAQRQVLEDLNQSVAQSTDLFRKSNHIYEQIGPGGYSRLRASEVAAITEECFLLIVLAWEEYLEESFVRYMCGARSPSGYRPKKYVSPPDQECARRMVWRGREYSDWLNQSSVRQLAALYFENGEPYENALSGAATTLEDVRIIRNAIAHRSKKSAQSLETIVSRILGYHPTRRIRAGRFLQMKLGTPSVAFFDQYVLVMLAVAAQITPV